MTHDPRSGVGGARVRAPRPGPEQEEGPREIFLGPPHRRKAETWDGRERTLALLPGENLPLGHDDIVENLETQVWDGGQRR